MLYLYTGSKFILGLYDLLSIDNVEGRLQQPPSRNMFGKKRSRKLGLNQGRIQDMQKGGGAKIQKGGQVADITRK